jgi:predicted transcriptional regulator
MTGPRELMQFVSASPNRLSALRALDEGGPRDRYELEDELDASRRTVTRTMESLEEYGFVSRGPDGYRLTQLGSFLASTVEASLSRLELADRLSPFFRHVPEGVVDVDLEGFADADVVVADDASPYLLLERVLELRAGASRIRELAPGVERRSIEQLAERARSAEPIDVDVVLDEGALAAAESAPPYESFHKELLASDEIDVYRGPDSAPLYAATMDDIAVLIAEADGRPYALVETRNPDVHEWTETYIERLRDRATPLEPSAD